MTLLADRLAATAGIPLTVGSHQPPVDDNPPAAFCLLERFAYVTGQTWTDSPPNCCPTIAAFGRRINDRGSQQTRDAIDAWTFTPENRIRRAVNPQGMPYATWHTAPGLLQLSDGLRGAWARSVNGGTRPLSRR